MFSLEKRAFDTFMRRYKDGKYGSQRLGQAFYNEFSLHKMKDQEGLHNLWEKDGEHALASIKNIFNIS
jgi:hypothetical protein